MLAMVVIINACRPLSKVDYTDVIIAGKTLEFREVSSALFGLYCPHPRARSLRVYSGFQKSLLEAGLHPEAGSKDLFLFPWTCVPVLSRTLECFLFKRRVKLRSCRLGI